jgi:hypothetical protein
MSKLRPTLKDGDGTSFCPHGAEATVGVYNNACARNWASTDASNKGSGLGSLYTDADGA